MPSTNNPPINTDDPNNPSPNPQPQPTPAAAITTEAVQEVTTNSEDEISIQD